MMKTDAVDRLAAAKSHDVGAGDGGPPGQSGMLDLIVTRVWLCVRRRAAWLESLGIGTAEQPSSRAPASVDPDDVTAERTWQQTSEAGRRWNVAIEQTERALAGAAGVHLGHIAAAFALSEPDLDLLQICVATHLDPSLGASFAHIYGNPSQTFVTDALTRQLFGYGRQPIWDPTGPLAVWNLVRAAPSATGEAAPLSIDPAVIGWLCGRLTTSKGLAEVLRRVPLRDPLPEWPIAQLAARFKCNLEGDARLRLVIEGRTGSGRASCAAVAAAQLGIDCFSIDTSEISDEDWQDVFTQAQRLAVLGSFGLLWRGNRLDRRWVSQLVAAPVQVVVCDNGQSLPPCADWIDYRLLLPEPSVDERRRLWQLAVPEAVAWNAPDLESLAERYDLTPGEITAVGGRGVKSAVEAAELARETTRHRLGDLGKILECPFQWDDMVLPAPLMETLRDFAFEARERVRFWENHEARRLFPRGTGLTALFDGPSGTGKTMATQVIAAELGFDLIRIDMARVVSKYIGETAKHLSQIFSRAARMSAVLLFDEADALFAKRTEVKDSHDRHANTDTSYLLQLLEEFRGVALLTTNKKNNIDPAFVRRIRYVFDFPKPDAQQRRRIYGNVVRALAGAQTEQRLSLTLDNLAGGTPVSGAQIKNAVLAAVFIARRQRTSLGSPHLLAGLNRELTKEGRSVAARERVRIEEIDT